MASEPFQEILVQCQRDVQKLQKTQGDLLEVSSAPLVASLDNDCSNVLIGNLQEHIKRYKAEIQALAETELRSLPQDESIIRFVLEQENEKSIVQLTETLAFLRSKRADVVNAIEEAEREHGRLQSGIDLLKAKCTDEEQDKEERDDVGALSEVLQDMSTKLDKVLERERFYHKTLNDILRQDVPFPGQTTTKKNLDESRDLDVDHLLSFRSIVGKLIEQTINRPEQPYIDINHRVSPEYVEFLLRCQIAMKDPSNPSRMKLIPFHM